MASIKRRPNGVWRARYRCLGCEKHTKGPGEHSKHFKRKTDGQAWLTGQVSALARGEWQDPATAKVTVRQWCEQWLEGQSGNRVTTAATARAHVKLIVAEFGNTPLSAVRPSQVRAWTARLKQTYSDAYVYALYRRLAQIMGDAAHDGLILRSPCSRRTAPSRPEQRPYVATLEQVWALHDALPAHLAPAILLGAFAGLRISEAVGLRVADVDFMRGVITPAVQYRDRPLKTPGSASPVPIPQELSLMLSAAVKHATDLAGAKATHVVSNRLGRPTTRQAVEEAIVAARTEVEGLPEGFRHHDLRHFYASALIAAGRDIKTVQKCLRHASAVTTLDTYGHLFPDADESARVAVAGLLAARPEASERNLAD